MKVSKLIIGFNALCAVSLMGMVAFGDTKSDAEAERIQRDEDRREAENTLAYINQMNYAYVVMKTYHNVLAVQEQYERLSLDRIDVTQIPQMVCEGVSIKQLIFDMQDALHALSVQEKDYAHYKKCQAEAEKRKRQKLWIDMLTTVPRALAGAGDVIKASYDIKTAQDAAAATGSNAAPYKEYAVAFNAIVSLVGDVVGGPVKTYMDYDNELNSMRALQDSKGFEYDKSKEEKAHNANKLLLKAEIVLAKKFNFSSRQIVAPDELQRLMDVLKMGNDVVIFSQLNTPEMVEHVGAFAPYWHYLGFYALNAGNYEVAASASQEFLKRNKSIVVNDSMVAESAAVELAALMGLDGEGEKRRYTQRVKELLDIIASGNFDGKNVGQTYLCAQATYSYLDDAETALKIVERAIGRLQNAYEQRLVEYRNLYKNAENPKWKEVPSETDVIRFHALYGEIIAKRKTKMLIPKLKAVVANDTTCSLEKLFYCGAVTSDILWQEAKRDVEAIGLWYFKDDECFWAELPVSWFILGDVTPTIKLMRGCNVVTIIEERRGGRKIRANKQGVGSDIVSIPFAYDGDFKGVDTVVFDFPHVSWPIKITYSPLEGYSVPDGEWENDVLTFAAQSVNFMEKNKEVAEPERSVHSNICAHKQDGFSDALLPFSAGTNSISNDYVMSVSIGTNQSIIVAYTNPLPKQVSIAFNINLYNKFGAFVWHDESKVTLDCHMSGQKTFAWPQELIENASPDLVYFQYRAGQDLMDTTINKGRAAKIWAVKKWRQWRNK